MFGEHLEFIRHALAGEINGLEFEGAPIHRLARGMNEHVVDSTDEIAAVLLFFLLRLLRAKAVQKTNLAQNDWLFGLEQCLADPLENRVSFEKSLRACGDHWTNASNRAVT